MVIKISPPDFKETKHAIEIHPRANDDVAIGECFNGFTIATDYGSFAISMRDGAIEISVKKRGDDEYCCLGNPIAMADNCFNTLRNNHKLSEVIVDDFGLICKPDEAIDNAIILLKQYLETRRPSKLA